MEGRARRGGRGDVKVASLSLSVSIPASLPRLRTHNATVKIEEGVFDFLCCLFCPLSTISAYRVAWLGIGQHQVDVDPTNG